MSASSRVTGLGLAAFRGEPGRTHSDRGGVRGGGAPGYTDRRSLLRGL